MHRSTRRLPVFVAALALLVPAVSCGDGGPGAEDVPGVTDTEILVGTHQPLTGPAAAGYSKNSAATKAYFDFVNANGGVHGRKIRYKVMDDAYNPSNTQQVVRELVLRDKVFAILNGLGTPTHTGVLDFLNTNRVPDLFVASGSRSWDQPDAYRGTFGFQPDYTVEGKILATHVQNELSGKRLCFLGQDDDFGRDSLAGVETVLGKDAVAAKQNYVPTNANVAPQIGALKAADCEVVILATVPGFTALALGTAARIGFQPQWLVSNVGGDYATLSEQLGEEGTPLLEGMLSAGYLPSTSTNKDNPWYQLFSEVNDEYNDGVRVDGNVMYGMAVGYLFVQVLQEAGPELTRESLIEAVESGGYTGPGLVPLRFAPDDHSGYAGVRITQVRDSVQGFVGPTYVTDEADGPVEEHTGKPVTPPENGIPGG